MLFLFLIFTKTREILVFEDYCHFFFKKTNSGHLLHWHACHLLKLQKKLEGKKKKKKKDPLEVFLGFFLIINYSCFYLKKFKFRVSRLIFWHSKKK